MQLISSERWRALVEGVVSVETEARSIKKRNRFKQTASLIERLAADTRDLRHQLKVLPPGPVRNQVVRRIRQNEAASELSKLLGPGSGKLS